MTNPLFEDFSYEPHVPERVHHSALEHPPDRVRSSRRVRMFLDWTVLDRSSVQHLPVHGDGIVHEELDSDGRETSGRWTVRPVRGRLVGEEELGAVNRESGDDMSATVQVPQERRAECGCVELDRSIPVTDGEHGRDLSSHRVHANIDTSRLGSFRNELRSRAENCARFSC